MAAIFRVPATPRRVPFPAPASRVPSPEPPTSQVSSPQVPSPASPSPQATPNEYLEKLVKMIPAEVVGLYLVGSGVIPSTSPRALLCWTIFCLIAVVVVRALGTRDGARRLPAQWGAVFISSVAFVIWVYTLGGSFKFYLGNDYQPYLGSLLMLAWTFMAPLIYSPAV